MRLTEVDELRHAKLERLKPLLRTDMIYTWDDSKINFLTEELSKQAHINDTTNVSANTYDNLTLDTLNRYPDGLILDCGAGFRSVYFENVVNYEVVDYPSTDVIGIGEELPFKDASFDGVFSLAVLEHVRDPFKCAKEIARVVKPGGFLVCCVPFLQPLHGYPNHYFNMSHQGLRSLFEDSFDIEWQHVLDSGLPIWTLQWFLTSWAQGLTPATRKKFMNLKVKDFFADPKKFLSQPIVRELSEQKNFELASTTSLIGRKPLLPVDRAL